MIPIKKLSPDAVLPKRGSQHAAGYDLSALAPVRIYPEERAVIHTGIAMAIPSGYVGMIRPRSGLALKHGIDVMAGVIDADYRGELMVILVNHGNRYVDISAGDRVAQLVIEQYLDAELAEVDELDETVRDIQGFGSTGQ